METTTTKKWYKKNLPGKLLLAYLLLIGGLVCGTYFLVAFDTSVEVPQQELFGQTIGGERVNNIGLMQDRQNGIYLGFGAAALGLVIRVLDKGGVVGKRIDFLLQEINRETNTIASKSIDLNVSQSSIELKVLIEQIREQIQNLE